MRTKEREYALERKLGKTLNERDILCKRIDRAKNRVEEYMTYCDCNGRYDSGTVSLSVSSLKKLLDILDGKEQ